ncbi:enoyl-Coa hydratase [Arthrobacter sp. Hiyo4]|nr:enoyl-Coa hydratase [Arthrobacter sp. Hiyo4]
MTEQSTIHVERTSPQVAKITFANPPVNLIVGETVHRLTEIVEELATDPDIQVVVFDSGVPDFFYNHFDLAAAADFPAPEGEGAVPVWTDLVLKLSKAPTSPSQPSGAAPVVGQRARTRVRPALRQPRKGNLRAARGRRWSAARWWRYGAASAHHRT